MYIMTSRPQTRVPSRPYLGNIRVILHSFHSDDGNPTSANIKQALRQVFPMVAATSLRRVRSIATCSYSTNICKDIIKAQVHVLKDLRYSDTRCLPWSHKVLKLKNFKKDGYTSFQDEERYEHVGPKVTSSQEGKRSQDDEEIMFG
ncbi:hypothetical protein Tco_1028358 [Tanacetum coccineum]|uniref:Uncharacterized protein n=1 Tax=Tanacetum coccineum TaxID=301880 RepID=A0ABQ5G267_9ASTR